MKFFDIIRVLLAYSVQVTNMAYLLTHRKFNYMQGAGESSFDDTDPEYRSFDDADP